MSKAGQTLSLLDNSSLAFPCVSHALSDPNGLLAIGGDLKPARIIESYRQGIFPWFGKNEPILWWSPNPRAIIPCNDIRINRTLQKFIKKSPYRITLNTAFTEVIEQCADAPFRKEETWILPDMIAAYADLHKRGFAHSIEVWQEEKLVGGLYGIAINGYFSGESMFYAATNASKIALIALTRLLESIDVTFIDCQLTNPFLESMGCSEISREQFLQLKDNAMKIAIEPDFWQPRELSL